eukprot:c14377_g1_i1.p1 GENE.c14377_g1_i1~~c14377_g1_i1.p1  ORF type:complete len:624 (+),score=148.92 c14377_g1_i1:39-1910(+)
MEKKAQPASELKDVTTPTKDAVDMNMDGSPFFQKPSCFCNDFFFTIIFAVFMVGLFTIWGIAGERGNINRLTSPMDFEGNLCGIDAEFKDRKYLAWYNKNDTESMICVESCYYGAANIYWDHADIYDPDASSDVRYTRTQEIEVFRRCEPKDMSNMPEKMKLALKGEAANEIFNDFEFVWWVLFVVMVISALTSFFYIFLMRHLAKEMMYGTIFIIIALLIILGGVFLAAGSNNLPDNIPVSTAALTQNQQITSLTLGIIFIFAALLVLIAVCIFGKKISLVGNIIEEAGLILLDIPSILLLPILPLFFCIGWTFLWFYETMLIVSCPSIDTRVPAGFSKGHRVGVMDSTTQFALFYHVFAYLWVLFIAEAITRTTIAACASTWYFTRDKDDHPSKSDQISFWVVPTSLYRTIYYNFGSIVLGTLLTTLLTIVKFFVILLQKLNKEKEEERTNFFLKCTAFCVVALSAVVSYINKYAYIQIAMYGIGFGKAAHRSAEIIGKNMGKIALVDTVGDFMLLLCRLVVAATSALIFKAILSSPQFSDITNPEALTLIAGFISFLIATTFFGVMETTIDAVLICFCEDIDHNGPESKSNTPLYMREKLRECIEAHENLMVKQTSDSKK